MPASVDVRDGRLVLVRTGPGAAEEADVLARLGGPGVPEVLEHDAERVVLSWAPALASPTSAELGVVAGAVARAHDLGIVHGPFAAEHLRCGPLLAGWGAAPPGWTAADDVRAFADLLDGPAAARARSDAPPTMAALAASLAPAAAELRPPVRPVAPRWRRPHAPVALALAALVLAVALVAHGLRGAPAATSTPPSISVTTTSTTAPPAPVIVDGVVRHAGRRWAVGAPGDVVVLGRWSCDADATPAVLRPSTGQVWWFDRWPDGAGPVPALAVATVPGARSLDVRHDGRCEGLVVVDADGQRTSVG